MIIFGLWNMVKDPLLVIMRSPQTIFTFKDIFLLWRELDSRVVQQKMYRYVKSGKLFAIRRGVYCKDKNFNPKELATKIFRPSYVSFQTVLAEAGVIFQWFDHITVASYLSREIVVANQKYTLRKIKNAVLTNPAGITHLNDYSVASTERAFLDTMYVSHNYFFDNLRPLDWKKVFALLPIYQNKSMTRRVRLLHKKFLDTQ